MDFLPYRKLGFRTIITDYLPGQVPISTRDMTFKIEKGIEILNNKTKIGATYNKANKSHLFVTVFARVPASKKITTGTCTLIPANALHQHPAPNVKSDIEHFNGHRCSSGFDYNCHRDIFRTLSSLYRDYACLQTVCTMTAKTRAMLHSLRPY